MDERDEHFFGSIIMFLLGIGLILYTTILLKEMPVTYFSAMIEFLMLFGFVSIIISFLLPIRYLIIIKSEDRNRT